MKFFRKHTLLCCFVFFGVHGFAQNVMISNVNDPNEPSIKMNPLNTDILVAGANLNNYYTSSDGGQTWSNHTLTSSYGVWGDPVIDVDPSGDFYFFHLSNPSSGNWIDRIVCQKSTDNGNSWNDGSYTGLNGTKAQDKQWSIIDRTTGTIYLTWTQFDNYGSANPNDKSIILFSKSEDGGNSWSTPLKINEFDGDCIDSDNTVEGATPALGPNGEIYVAWAGPNGLVFNRSLDDGDTWLSQEIAIDPMPTGWDYAIPGIYRGNGLPITKCDLSGGPNNGTIYVNWSDQRNGSNDTDVWLSKSTDGGDTWTSPVRVNDDPAGKDQFFTWMDIDQTNGNLHFVFYDRREYSDTQTDVYLAYSTDGGNTFVNKKISETPFVPNPGVFFGDYTNITVHNNVVRPIWTRLHNGQLSLWTDITPFEVLQTEDFKPAVVSETLQYPNPASNISYVSFKLHQDSNVSLYLYDQQGRKVFTVFENEQKGYGKFIIPIDLDQINLEDGVYYCKLSVNGSFETLRMLVIQK
ncbi:MAG TPA: T9SS type A sorting domain-containing protein [Flavobacteriaceae bacterium]|nr:T9SS type A sorting domain-containing protein [Flavobacteriaceae bacterium]MCB9213566.1 T9SS type A sorting domain-containing protein [Alteromonas sp.]HPF12067.1 T9SS type A sorting domain-containing protein [Flavobacteriaceae bacterium]HQU21502.1 T9SS type A sorting domain-containing protein [Flavobacteriaceae bacterium]HQU65652.1 T9SS type A sorting domain-containing protein [Flavobacteriaceae bacterium]